jgi:diphosphomevalonate decarboxylase
MSLTSTTALACPNIAFIKYWGDLDPSLHIPANGSISMNLAGLYSRTIVSFNPSFAQDQMTLDGESMSGKALVRVSTLLDRVRRLAGISTYTSVDSQNNFPTAAGIASSAAGFAALTLAATIAAGLKLGEKELSRLARTGSGSACRSIPGGFVEWQAGRNDRDSYAYSIASPNHWDLVDCITILSQAEKPISSSIGHSLAPTSILQSSRVEDAPRRLDICREAILKRDFEPFAEVVELDSNLMHAVMITSTPSLLYWQPATITTMHAVQSWRKAGLPVCYSIDAGPNVHVLCMADVADKVMERLRGLPGVLQVLMAKPGGAATLEVPHPNMVEMDF